MAAKREKVIITCAVTGSIHTPTMTPYLPITPEEISRASIEAAEAGATVIHLHARDPSSGRPTPSPDVFMQFLPRIKQSCDAVLNITTGGGHGMTLDEFECYDVGRLYTLAHFLDRKLVRPPLFVQTIFGILGGIGADPENVTHMKRIADKLFGEDYHWSVLAAGRHQMSFVTMAAILGGMSESDWRTASISARGGWPSPTPSR